MATPAVGDPILLETAPGRRLATTTRTSNVGTFTATETQLDSVTASLISGHTYKIGYFVRISSSVADGRVLIRFRQNTSAGAEIAGDRVHTVGQEASQNAGKFITAQFTAAATGSKTFVATGQRESGTGNITAVGGSTLPVYFFIEYIQGP